MKGYTNWNKLNDGTVYDPNIIAEKLFNRFIFMIKKILLYACMYV